MNRTDLFPDLDPHRERGAITRPHVRGPKRPLVPRRRGTAFSTQPLGSSRPPPGGGGTRETVRPRRARCQPASGPAETRLGTLKVGLRVWVRNGASTAGIRAASSVL